MSPADPSAAPSHPGHEGSTGQPGEPAAVADRDTGQDAGEAHFTVGYVPGVMPGKWFGRWRERRMRPVLHDALLPAAGWRAALDDGAVTACFVRLGWAPGDPSLDELRTTHHAVRLYEERQVAVLGTADVLGVLDTLTTAQLREESMPQPHADIDDAAMAVELAAAGVGPVVLPMSVARLHARKDVTTREITDAPTVPVVLVWPKSVAEDTEEAIQRFVGIVRGRRESSGRDEGTQQPQRAASSGGGAGAARDDRSADTGRATRPGGSVTDSRPETRTSGAEGTAAASSGTGAVTKGAAGKTAPGKAQSGGWAKAGASTKPGLRRKPGRKVKNGRNKKRR